MDKDNGGSEMVNGVLNNVKKFFREYAIEIIIVAVCALGYVLYVSLFYSTEVLFLASFYGDVQLVEKYLTGVLVFKDILIPFAEHGMLGYNLLLLLNLTLFNYTAHFDLVINCINVLTCGIFLAYCIKDSVANRNIAYYFGIALVSVVMFSTMQGSSATMETQVRLGLMFFLFTAFFVSKIILRNTSNKTLIAAVILIFISINVFGTFYSFAGSPAFFILMILFSFKNRKIDGHYYIIAGAYLVATILYLWMYGKLGNDGPESGLIFNGIKYWMIHPINLLQSIFVYNASSIIGQSVFLRLESQYLSVAEWIYLLLGFFVTVFYVYTIWLFVKTKMYKKTLLPLLLQGYSFFIIMLILIGRYKYGTFWGISSWYHVHTKLGMAACIWILIYAFSKDQKSKSFSPASLALNSVIGYSSYLVIACCLLLGIYADISRAPYVREWYKNIANYMYVDASDMPVDKNGNTPLLTDKSTTIKCLRILKKYRLSVFRDSYDIVKPGPELTNKTQLILGNYYTDGWISKVIKVKMNTGMRGHLLGKIYLPDKNFAPNGITIFLNNTEIYSQRFNGTGSFFFEVDCEQDKEAIVKIVMDKAIIPKQLGINEDQRELSAILSEFYFE